MASSAAAASTTAEESGTTLPTMENVNSTQKRGRKKASARPRIDIDDEIEEANKLSAVMKKLAHAAKMAERNSQRCKQRLIRKCGKLSAADLERMSVLKRCGLLPGASAVDGTSATTTSSSSSCSAATSTCSAASSPTKRNREVMTKLAGVLSKHGEASHVMASVDELSRMFLKQDQKKARVSIEEAPAEAGESDEAPEKADEKVEASVEAAESVEEPVEADESEN